MTEIGYFLSSEEHGPRDLLSQAQMAERAGFGSVFVSDHFHPWVDRQGESPFVWSVIGAIAGATSLKVTTGVTCPIQRIHPVIVAQAAMTSQLLLKGRFVLGVGTGEALNEHVLGDRWPPAPVRLQMLDEAVRVMRKLWKGGSVTHRGRHYTVENARLYSCADVPPPVVVSAFGPRALALAARIGDGFVTTSPEASAVRSYREQGGKGPIIGAVKVCWGEDEAGARKLAHSLWATQGLPGQLSQDLPTPAHFEAAATLVTEEMVAEQIACGPDPERHAAAIRKYLDADFDELYVSQIGPDQTGFIDFYQRELRRRVEA